MGTGMNRTKALLAGGILAALAGPAALTACATAQPHAQGSAAAGSAAPGTATTRSPGSTASATPAAAASGPVPTLGRAAGLFAHGQGFGQVRPARIFNGGDPTGLVTQVRWRSWGGPRAVATGVSDWVPPGHSVATGKQQPVRVVAFRLGRCGGKLMYRAVEWYFPQHRQHFDAGRYQDICTGGYVPAP